MSNPIIQPSFNSGEWAPALNARVDLAKYHSGAALLRNFFVDYRGGATTRPGTRYVLQTRLTSTVRILPFQASFTVTYILEFGQGYVRFFNNAAPVLEAAKTISNITQANPAVVTSTAHGFSANDWVFISGVVGMVQVNGNYFFLSGVTANTFQLNDLFGNPFNSTSLGTYVSGGTVQRVYTITSPYQASELAGLKFVQNVNQMYLTHPNYPPYVLTLISATNWTLAPIVIGATLTTPGISSLGTSLAAGVVSYAYKVTAVDVNGQESAPSAPANVVNLQDLRTVAGTIAVNINPSVGSISTNVYKAIPYYGGGLTVPIGAQFGFIGNCTGTVFIDSNISPDFTQGIPIVQNPFSGTGVQTINVTAQGSFGGAGGNPVPTISFTGGGGSGAAAVATLTCFNAIINTGGTGYFVGDVLFVTGGVYVQVTGVSGARAITGVTITNGGSISAGSTPLNPAGSNVVSGSGLGSGTGATFGLTYGVSAIGLISPGTGYTTPPAVVFSYGTAAATAILGAPSAGNPTVPALHQQRLTLSGPVLSPAQMNFSQPGTPFNFNIEFPLQPDDAIQATLTNTTLNSIKSMVSVSAGLIVFSDKGAWLINGGSSGSPISALSLVANPQGYSGASDLPPITTPTDILYVQAKQSIVRDLAYNFYLNNYLGTDISILSSHLFYGFTLKEWTWAEEPFKTAWAVRNDGQLLSLCFVKEQEMIAWAHSDTQGSFQSIASVTETTTSIGSVDAVYHVVQRTINGNTVQYIERFVELTYPNDYKSSWQVDAGIGYNGAPATIFTGAQHLAGMAVTGVADGAVINFTMPINGVFQFGIGGTVGLTTIPNASIVTVGLAFLPQLAPLALDLGQPTVQGKRKKVAAVTTRVKQALGLSAGKTLATVLPMQDLILNNVGSMSNALVTGLVTSDARMIIDPDWDVFGQYFITQPNPYPASILGVIPEIEVGDD